MEVPEELLDRIEKMENALKYGQKLNHNVARSV
jgi:hypothetical protein